MNTSLESKIDLLKDRAKMLSSARSFFEKLNVLEVDCPALCQGASLDTHIDVLHVPLSNGQKFFLHTSPEYGMKRLLSQGIGDIYQISHVFRKDEIGPLHNPEFTMVEWYRLGANFFDFIEETLDFLRVFLGELSSTSYSYRDVLKRYAGIDYLTATADDLLNSAKEHGVELPQDAPTWDKDTLLQLIMSFVVEPHLGQDNLCVIFHFPGSQAALSKTEAIGNELVAKRFEVYYKGIELANGYHELTDAVEQRRRFEKANIERKKAGKETLPIDEEFIKALEAGMPDCCGVAAGFDRLLLLRNHLTTLEEILPFSWKNA